MSETQTRTLDFSVPTGLPGLLPVVALRQGVVLPSSVTPLTLGRKGAHAAVDAARRARSTPAGDIVIVALKQDPERDPNSGGFLEVATLARIIDSGQRPGGPPVVVVQGLARVKLGEVRQEDDLLRASWEVVPQEWPQSAATEGLLAALREQVAGSAEALGGRERVTHLMVIPLAPPLWIDAVAAALDAPNEWRRDWLATLDPVARGDKLVDRLPHAREVARTRKAVQERVKDETASQQKEFMLRQQLKAIQEELGESDDTTKELRARLDDAPLPQDVRKVVDRELGRLDRLRDGSPERSVAVDWLEWVAELPWGRVADEGRSLAEVEEALAESHHGLDDVKQQVVEHLAVRQLAGSGRADVLLLVGPPGVGKTSIGEAIAEATGRELVRIALGGVRDEASLRGHRRTYIGARPGRVIEGLRRAGSMDPVVLLDEVDKLGQGWQGDPSAALLEILDPEQNHSFTDHYMEVPVDLSKALFIATANELGTVPAPLRDRMEVLTIEGYTEGEKLEIVRSHLLGRLARNAGVAKDDVDITDEAILEAIGGWAREAGVRGLQRALGRIFRAVAVRKAKGTEDLPLRVEVGNVGELLGKRRFFDEDLEVISTPGIATGLAWTPVGGTVLHVEAAAKPGGGRLVLTGQLGDVMKESAQAALTYVLGRAVALGIEAPADQDIHIHVPAGAVPKDGPSAGVTMFTALASLLSGREVRPDTAMTGEATLRGRVLPVGGIKSKVLAAHRQGLRRIILPKRNAVDLEDVPREALDELEIVLVESMDEVLEAALV